MGGIEALKANDAERKVFSIEEKEWIMTGWKHPVPRKPNTKRLFTRIINRTRKNT